MTGRVLFLGSAYHPLAVASLDALVGAGVEVVVARELQAGQAREAVKRVWGMRGARAVARRAMLVAGARARLAARQLGVPLRGAASVEEVCRTRHLVTVPCDDPNGWAFVRQVRNLAVDLIVVANYSHILRRRLFSVPRLGAINVHPSLLPAFRGPDPIYWLRASGATEGGVSIHRVDRGIDTGPIIVQRPFPIAAEDDERAILARAVAVVRTVLPEAVALLLTGNAPAVAQDERRGTYFRAAPRGASAL
jgi:methionyl-tRNA formyltransferase